MAAPTTPTSIFRFKFGTYLTYSPRGSSAVSFRSRQICYGVKQDSGGAILQVVSKLAEDFAGTKLGQILGPDVALVPAPRSAPLVDGALWPARLIAGGLLERGFGGELLPIVKRLTPVAKSANAGPGERTTVPQHSASLGLEPLLANPKTIVIVDDVMTKGRMALAMALLLRERFPEAELRAFSLLRTLGLQPDVEKIVDPCVGVIEKSGDEAKRLDTVPPEVDDPQGELF